MWTIIREVRTVDPMVKGAVKKYEVVPIENIFDFEPLSSHWSEHEAERERVALMDL